MSVQLRRTLTAVLGIPFGSTVVHAIAVKP